MRTTIDVDRKLLEEAERLLGETSPSVTVNRALDELIRRKKTEELVDSLGTWDLALDDWYEYRHQER